MKYFNYINKVKNIKDLEPIIQYINEEKEVNKKQEILKNDSHTFTILTKLNFSKCNLCLFKSTTYSEYLNHIWKSHLNQETYQHKQVSFKNSQIFSI